MSLHLLFHGIDKRPCHNQRAVDRATHGGDDRDVARYLARLIERVQSVAGVQSVGAVNRLPLGGQTQTLTIEVEARAPSSMLILVR